MDAVVEWHTPISLNPVELLAATFFSVSFKSHATSIDRFNGVSIYSTLSALLYLHGLC